MAKHDRTLDTLFSALADPTRRQILARLARGPASVSELSEPVDMALPSFMAHLRKLEAGGLIASEKKGRTRTCRLRPQAFQPVRTWLDEQRDLWTGRLDRFDDYVTRLAKERSK